MLRRIIICRSTQNFYVFLSLDANGVVAELAGPGGGGGLLAGLDGARLPAAPLAHEVEDQQAAHRPY